jgi:pimeloyl-ACP methyl ester carboxylesterase
MCFDFAGCGLSSGEYVSLGHYEKDDLTTIVAHLRSKDLVTRIALWGRSMGAVTSVMYGATDPSIGTYAAPTE